jgi:hypothetical protein
MCQRCSPPWALCMVHQAPSFQLPHPTLAPAVAPAVDQGVAVVTQVQGQGREKDEHPANNLLLFPLSQLSLTHDAGPTLGRGLDHPALPVQGTFLRRLRQCCRPSSQYSSSRRWECLPWFLWARRQLLCSSQADDRQGVGVGVGVHADSHSKHLSLCNRKPLQRLIPQPNHPQWSLSCQWAQV